jgi:hypothetical protein
VCHGQNTVDFVSALSFVYRQDGFELSVI